MFSPSWEKVVVELQLEDRLALPHTVRKSPACVERLTNPQFVLLPPRLPHSHSSEHAKKRRTCPLGILDCAVSFEYFRQLRPRESLKLNLIAEATNLTVQPLM